MERLGRSTILRALEAVARRLPDIPHSLALMGGAALVLLYDAREATKDVDAVLIEGGSPDELRRVAREVAPTLAPSQLLAMKLSAWRDDVDIEDARLLLSRLSGAREDVWSGVQPHLVPGRELKAQYAFADLWEAAHGSS